MRVCFVCSFLAAFPFRFVGEFSQMSTSVLMRLTPLFCRSMLAIVNWAGNLNLPVVIWLHVFKVHTKAIVNTSLSAHSRFRVQIPARLGGKSDHLRLANETIWLEPVASTNPKTFV